MGTVQITGVLKSDDYQRLLDLTESSSALNTLKCMLAHTHRGKEMVSFKQNGN